MIGLERGLLTSLQPLFPVVPGGERQRELAYRFGINIVMYTLTGNYKGDQVHSKYFREIRQIFNTSHLSP